MRVSVRPNDSGFSTLRLHGAGAFQVFLDGAELTDVITADEEEGLVDVRLRNEDGEHYVDPEISLTEAAFETRIGKVEVKIRGANGPD